MAYHGQHSFEILIKQGHSAAINLYPIATTWHRESFVVFILWIVINLTTWADRQCQYVTEATHTSLINDPLVFNNYDDYHDR